MPSGTNVNEIASGIYRISTPLPPEAVPGGFTFNQYLVLDDEPLLFHTGPRGMFPLVRDAVATVMPVERLRWIGFARRVRRVRQPQPVARRGAPGDAGLRADRRAGLDERPRGSRPAAAQRR
jgi:hypothetical protein